LGHYRFRQLVVGQAARSPARLRSVTAISKETLRLILRAGGVSWQTTTTWKASTEPDFITKMHRILDLYDHPPTDGRVVCVDEFGPLNLMPRTGKRGAHAESHADYAPPTIATMG
jgi:hypothetical protein